MTFIEEELEAVEKTPQYRRVLKVLLKYQIYTLCQRLSEVGEESYVVTANVSDGTFSHLGSRKGENYLEKLHDAEWKFLSFCSSRGADDQPQEFEELPEQSQQYEDVSQAYEENTEEAEQDPSDFDSRDAPSEEVDDGNAMTEAPIKMRRKLNMDLSTTESVGRFALSDYPGKDAPGTFKQFPSSLDQKPFAYSEELNVQFSEARKPPKTATLVDFSGRYIPGRIKLEPQDNVDNVELPADDNQGNEEKLENVTMVESLEFPSDYNTHLGDESGMYIVTSVAETMTGDHFPASQSDYIGWQYIEKTLDRKFQCKICMKSFKYSTHLKDHIRIHTGEKPYRCTECSKCFTQKSHLTEHKRTHGQILPPKSFHCCTCGQTFKKAYTYSAHLLTHKQN